MNNCNERKRLYAGAGHVLTNGRSFGRVVLLAKGNNGYEWYEITEEEYQRRVKEANELDQ